MKDKVKVVSRNKVLKQFFDVEKVELQYPGQDKPIERYRVIPKRAAAILLYNPDKKTVIFSCQYRFAVSADDKEVWVHEVPAGVCDDDEDTEKTARREALEETGYDVKDVSLISQAYTSPGYTAETIDLYYGEISSSMQTEDGGGKADENEFISIKEISLDEAMRMMQDGRIKDAKTMLCLYWLQYKLQKAGA